MKKAYGETGNTKMSSKLSTLSFFLVVGYFAMNIMGSEQPSYEKAAYETAMILITSMLPPTVHGTKWCGHDISAKSHDSLGDAVETDKCCREWHNCDEFILPHAEKYEIQNTANFKMLHCHCNTVFHNCLKNVTGMEAPTATQIGIAYFNVISPKCLRKMYYEPTCEVSYYDDYGNKHPDNGVNQYFCPQLSSTIAW